MVMSWQGRYDRYKQDTSIFLNWLGRSAVKCGWAPVVGRGSTRGSSTAAYVVTTADIDAQIDWVLRTKHVLPPEVEAALRSTITLRRQYADWHKSIHSPMDTRDSHAHFNSLLEKALHGMLPSRTTTPGPMEHALINRFTALAVDYTEDGGGEPLLPEAHFPGRETEATFECDHVHKATLPLEVYSFFKDISDIRTHVLETWSSFQKSKVDLTHATIMTMTALEFARRSEDDICQRFRAAGGLGGDVEVCYPELIGVIVPPLDLENGLNDMMNPASPWRTDAATSSVWDFIYHGPAFTLQRLVGWDIRTWNFPPFIPTIRDALGDDCSWSHDPGFVLHESQETFICQVAIDMMLHDAYCTSTQMLDEDNLTNVLHKTLGGMAKDAFTTQMRRLWQSHKVTTQMVFAAQLMWDIHSITNSDPKCDGVALKEQCAVAVQNSFRYEFDRDGNLVLDKLPYPVDGALPTVFTEVFTATFLQARHLFPKMKNMYIEQRAHLLTGMASSALIQVQRDPHFLDRSNLMAIGTQQLQISALVEKAGVNIANAHGSIFMVAHLYNAVVQLGMKGAGWTIMDDIIELHGNTLFAGDIPHLGEVAHRFDHRMGTDPAHPGRYTQLKRHLFETTKATETLREFFAGKGGDLRALVGDLVVQARGHAGHAGILSPHCQGRPPTTHDLLQNVDTYLRHAIANAGIDYVRLTRVCNAMMKALTAYAMQQEMESSVPLFSFPAKISSMADKTEAKQAEDCANRLLVTRGCLCGARRVGLGEASEGDMDSRLVSTVRTMITIQAEKWVEPVEDFQPFW